ncbi:hypothetical protein COE51_23775 [Bacillus pseudomycoides]|nr:hypothetical protein COE51_23775 [Bacillus pseudomycoides]
MHWSFFVYFSFLIDANGVKVAIDKEKVTYDEAKQKADEKEKELTYTKSKVKEGMDAEEKKLDDKKKGSQRLLLLLITRTN